MKQEDRQQWLDLLFMPIYILAGIPLLIILPLVGIWNFIKEKIKNE